jgi:hypothetical protein
MMKVVTSSRFSAAAERSNLVFCLKSEIARLNGVVGHAAPDRCPDRNDSVENIESRVLAMMHLVKVFGMFLCRAFE